MKKLISLIFALLLFPAFLSAQSLTGLVVSIADGDTITVLDSNKVQYKIRLNGIDCPEKSQDFGQNAKKFTSDFCYNKTVTVYIRDIDRYKRYVGDVEVNGQSLNKALVAAGYAWHYKQYSKDKELARLEIEARTAKRGLWAGSKPIPPWEYRKSKKASSRSN
jgi:endonuclease YncB( thermonuclease family)